MQKSLFENQNIVEALKPTLRICSVSGSFSSITYKQAVDFLLPRHYSGRKPSITFSFGYFENNELKAVCTFGKPASNSLCIGVCGKEYSEKVFELNRLCVDGEIEIQLSKFVAWCLNELKAKDLILVSYADTQMNHNGYIYQATNWIYTGMTRKENIYLNKQTGKILHPRTVVSLFGSRSKNSLPDYIQILKEEKTKHRYFQFLGNKKEIKFMLENFKYCRLQYPKGNNIRYDTSYEVKKIGFFEE